MDLKILTLILGGLQLAAAVDSDVEFKSSEPKPGSVYEAIKTDYEEFVKANKRRLPKKPTDLTEAVADNMDENRKKLLYNFTDTKFRDDLVNRIKNEGQVQIRSFGKLLRKNIKTTIDARNISKNIAKRAAKDFESNIEVYYSYIQSETSKGRPSNELILADIIDICNRVLMAQKRRMLHEFVEKTKKNIEKTNFDAIGRQLSSDKINNKKNNLIWICLQVRVCKPYPGFTDYLADILNYVVKLQDKKYTTFISTSLNVLKNMTSFIDQIIDKNNSKIIVGMLDPENNATDSKKVLSELSITINNKHKYVYNKHPIMRAISLSKRIITEMVDKVFYKFGEEMVRIEFENTLSALKKWEAGKRDDLNEILYYYLGNMIRQCGVAWRDAYRDEVNCLLEIVLQDEPRNHTLARNILMNGSDYINVINTRIS